MTLRLQVIAGAGTLEAYRAPLSAALAAHGITADLSETHAPETVDYVIYAPTGPDPDLAPYIKAKAVLGLWAGVERILANPTLTQPYARMVDPGLMQGMVEYVCGHVLRHHLGMDAQITRQRPEWSPTPPPLANARRIGVAGLGALGRAVAEALAGLGFQVAGWSNSPKDMPGIECYHGAEWPAFLAGLDMLVLLVPHTPDTENLINGASLARLPKGAVLINPGRGALIDEAALLTALESGQVSHATLDTFRIEPLPEDHPFWAHPRVTVTPHIAAETRAETAARVLAENIRRIEAGEELLHRVDPTRGY